MNIGNELLTLRKRKGLSQEEAADKLGVSRQTISKWETNQSTPDFDKIIPLCELYDISTDELLKGQKPKKTESKQLDFQYEYGHTKKRAKFIGLGVFLYFLSITTFVIIPVTKWNPIIMTCLFLLICGLATCFIIYGNLVYRKSKTPVKHDDYPPVRKTLISIVTLISTVLYFTISFITFAWYITWIIWIINAIVIEILRLIFSLKEAKNEK